MIQNIQDEKLKDLKEDLLTATKKEKRKINKRIKIVEKKIKCRSKKRNVGELHKPD